MSRLAQRIIACLAICLVCTPRYFSIVQASEIRTELCNPSATPSLSITSPSSDSTVNISNLRLQGTANNTSHIEIFINGNDDSTIIVGPSGVINEPIQLAKGTNSISLHAYYSCNQSSSITTFVVTYEPSAPPSTGSSMVTVLPSPGSISASNSVTSTTPPLVGNGSGLNNGESSPLPNQEDSNQPNSETSPKAPQNVYVLALVHLFALGLLGYLLYITERLFILASRTRRRPTKSLKLIVRCTYGLLAGLIVWLLLRAVLNYV